VENETCNQTGGNTRRSMGHEKVVWGWGGGSRERKRGSGRMPNRTKEKVMACQKYGVQGENLKVKRGKRPTVDVGSQKVRHA